MKSLVLALVLAATGDRIFIRRGGEFAPTASERTALGACITNVDATAVPATIQRLECFKRDTASTARCRALDQRTVNATTFQVREDAGVVHEVISVDGSGNVTYNHQTAWFRLTAGQWNCFANWADAALGPVTAASVRRVEAWREAGSVRARVNYQETLAPASYVQVPRDEVAQPVGVE